MEKFLLTYSPHLLLIIPPMQELILHEIINSTFGVAESTFSSMLDKVLDTSKARLRAVHKLVL
jgi:hypothetical protein